VSPLRVLLVDDHTLVRAGLRALIETLPGVEVVAEAGDGHAALALADQHRPRIVFLDIALPGLNGLEVAARLRVAHPEIRILVLSMHSSEEYVLRALRAGVSGYLLKDATVAELELAVRAVERGETYLSPAVSKRVVDGYVERVGGDAPIAPGLTPRQREILQLVAEGHSTKAIAKRLGVSVKTVESHRADLMERLDIHDVPGLVLYALRTGIVKNEG
jgi:DNA-binding NarL/FixJ family response regulator